MKINVIPNGLEKHIAFTINRNLVFIDSMLFILNALVKNLSEIDFKYLLQKFGGELLEVVKQKDVYPCKYMNCYELPD